MKIKLLEFFERELAKEKKTRFAAVITDVRPNGLFVELIESMTFGFIPITVLTDDVYTINGSGDALVGRRTKTTYQLAARLEVAVEKVDRFKRLIDFRPAGPGGSAATSAMPMDKPKPHPSVPEPKKKYPSGGKPKNKTKSAPKKRR